MSSPTYIETSLERRPVPGLEDLYEITRRGDVYSRRLKRFVTRSDRPVAGDAVIIEEGGRRRRLPIATIVADVFLSDQEREMILNEFLDLYQAAPGVFDRDAAIERLAARHHVASGVILAVIVRASDGA